MVAMILITIGLFFIFGVYLFSSGMIDAAIFMFPVMLIVIFIIIPNFFMFDDDDEIERKDFDCTIEWKENDDE